MSRSRLAVRVALGWVDRYTATAPEPERSDRRAEVRSDIHDQMARDDDEATSPNRVLLRAVRGIPADLSWRLSIEIQPARLSWHVSNPGTALAALLVPMVILGMVIDSARKATWLAPAADVAGAVFLPLSSVVVGVGLVGVVRWCARPMRPGLAAVRRQTLAAATVTWALAGLWRFAPAPWEVVSALAWAGVGISVVAYLAVVFSGRVVKALALRKVPS